MKALILAVLAALVLAPTASASAAGKAVTAEVAWGGATCINVMGPTEDMMDITIGEACAPPGQRLWGYRMALTQRGQWYGLNPYMGDATWITCTTYVNKSKVDFQMATKGDGTEVDCLRTL